MGRNLRIAGMMLGLTLIVHIVIFHKEVMLQPGMSQMRMYYNSSTAIQPKIQPENCQPKQNLQSSILSTTTKHPPRGDGLLYEEIARTGAPYIQGWPKQVVILGYQRVGSSFFGQIFDRNPNFFYIYEPLDAVYTEMYGTKGGLNVPSDITYNADGTEREIPQDEKAAAVNLLSDILNCRTASLSQGFLLHKFWYFLVDEFMPSWKRYKSCLKRKNILKEREICQEHHLGKVCPPRFGIHVPQQNFCKERLANATAGDPGPFGGYKRCLNNAYRNATSCISVYDQKCSRARMWVTKTVRGTMDEMDSLLQANPNMRIIHLVRDPRPVVVSRSTEYSYRGIYTGNITQNRAGDVLKESHIYCGSVTRDLRYRKLLESQYPGRIVQVIYEDFVQHPDNYIRALYQFLGESIPPAIASWIKFNTQGNKYHTNSRARMNAWKSKMTYATGERIQYQCREFYEILNYKWPYHDA